MNFWSKLQRLVLLGFVVLVAAVLLAAVLAREEDAPPKFESGRRVQTFGLD